MLKVFIALFIIFYVMVLIISWRETRGISKTEIFVSGEKIKKEHPVIYHIMLFIVAVGLAIIFFGIYLTLPMTLSDL